MSGLALNYCRHGEADYMDCERCRQLIHMDSYPMFGFEPSAIGSAMWEHNLKILPEFYGKVKDGRKNFEIRRNDRDFRTGDVLQLRAWDAGEFLDAKPIRKVVTYLTDFEQKPGFVVMGLETWLWISVPR